MSCDGGGCESEEKRERERQTEKGIEYRTALRTQLTTRYRKHPIQMTTCTVQKYQLRYAHDEAYVYSTIRYRDK